MLKLIIMLSKKPSGDELDVFWELITQQVVLLQSQAQKN